MIDIVMSVAWVFLILMFCYMGCEPYIEKCCFQNPRKVIPLKV